ncbi:cytochrome oxidase putative small subunit CydP [Ketobacter sp.]|uniref:cytochrome oxidase putative small subunit CydP n=1 Tax=Ketobacter sp. TaxID=2083498 RepID=UPI0025C164D2|nr:cytochrome oxidase putative small subunit CydP [Ketobacter sp.]
MQRMDLSLRRHVTWILLVKLVLIISLKMAFFPSLEQQHQPADLYLDSPADASAKEHP